MKDNTANEIWKDIAGYEGRYQVSNLGRVKSLSRVTHFNGRVRTEPERIMAFSYRVGYPTVNLRKDGSRCSKQVHRLVAEAFIPNPNNYPIVNHKDFIQTNNAVSNLEWCTQGHNVRWSSDNMCHPRKSKPTNTGEKYITKNKEGRYSVHIHRKRKEYANEFDTLEKAIRWREEKLREIQ